jgi:hypothetical protein
MRSAFGAFGAVSVTLTRHHKQLSCLTLRVSHRAWIEPGEWLNTKPSSIPRGATPTHAGRWGSAWRAPPYLQTTEATGFSPKPDRLQAGDRIGDPHLQAIFQCGHVAMLCATLLYAWAVWLYVLHPTSHPARCVAGTNLYEDRSTQGDPMFGGKNVAF